jgi:hypothetical protein
VRGYALCAGTAVQSTAARSGSAHPAVAARRHLRASPQFALQGHALESGATRALRNGRARRVRGCRNRKMGAATPSRSRDGLSPCRTGGQPVKRVLLWSVIVVAALLLGALVVFGVLLTRHPN